jgi:hypothetical protein
MILVDGRPKSLPPIELLIVIAINLAVVAIGYYAFRLWGFLRQLSRENARLTS